MQRGASSGNRNSRRQKYELQSLVGTRSLKSAKRSVDRDPVWTVKLAQSDYHKYRITAFPRTQPSATLGRTGSHKTIGNEVRYETPGLAGTRIENSIRPSAIRSRGPTANARRGTGSRDLVTKLL